MSGGVAEQEYVEDVALDRALRARCPSGPAVLWVEDEDEEGESWE